MDGHGTSPKGRCEGIPNPSEVSSPGKLRVFLILYNLITLNDTDKDLEMLPVGVEFLEKDEYDAG
jgi:hypothetical protein